MLSKAPGMNKRMNLKQPILKPKDQAHTNTYISIRIGIY